MPNSVFRRKTDSSDQEENDDFKEFRKQSPNRTSSGGSNTLLRFGGGRFSSISALYPTHCVMIPISKSNEKQPEKGKDSESIIQERENENNYLCKTNAVQSSNYANEGEKAITELSLRGPVKLQPFLHPELIDTNPCEITLRIPSGNFLIRSFTLITNAKTINLHGLASVVTLSGVPDRKLYELFNTSNSNNDNQSYNNSNRRNSIQSGAGIYRFSFVLDQPSQQINLVVFSVFFDVN